MNMPSGSILPPVAPPWNPKPGKSGWMPGTRKWSGSGSPVPGPIGSNLGRKPRPPLLPKRGPAGTPWPHAGCRGPSKPPSGVQSSGRKPGTPPGNRSGLPGVGRSTPMSPPRSGVGRPMAASSLEPPASPTGAGRFVPPAAANLSGPASAASASNALPKRVVELWRASSLMATPAATFSCHSRALIATTAASPTSAAEASIFKATVSNSAPGNDEAAWTARLPPTATAFKLNVSDGPRSGCM
mmetsp:Transcript_84902/g.245478  ORF Transcript_84902/g.245478 Transcript_84902/m.245478 type:complete len:242 (-) Transcript_84902:309-1034(-)